MNEVERLNEELTMLEPLEDAQPVQEAKPKRVPAKKKKEINYPHEYRKGLKEIEALNEQLRIAESKAEVLFNENKKLKMEFNQITDNYRMAQSILFESVSNALKSFSMLVR